MTDTRQHDELRNLLRRGDPAGGESLDAADFEPMRRRVLAEARGEKSPRAVLANAAAQGWLRRAAFGVAAMALLVLIAAGILWRTRPEAPDATADGRRDAIASPGIGADGVVIPADLRPARTIHFVTESGTRVIWTFDPNFTLDPEDARSHL